MSTQEVIIIGDSTYNTLSAVRSFGKADIQPELILVCESDNRYVSHSRYLKNGHCHTVSSLDDVMSFLESWRDSRRDQILMTTFDAAAEWIDAREPILSKWYRTPCRGKQLGKLFNKESQCKLAQECGFNVPYSVVYERGNPIPDDLPYPIITKPLVSSAGKKGDIHICNTEMELTLALAQSSRCDRFLIQHFIVKSAELNLLGVRGENTCTVGGVACKYRQWPAEAGGSTFGVFEQPEIYHIDVHKVINMLEIVGYHGPFSIEFLKDKNGGLFFLEINFRNDFLAYVPTCMGVNLHAYYVNNDEQKNSRKKIYWMDYGVDFLYVKEKKISFLRWFIDFLKTRCFINISFSDLGPAIAYYKSKFFHSR